MQTIVYSSSCGDHSDYEVCALFSTKASAIGYCLDRIELCFNPKCEAYKRFYPTVSRSGDNLTCSTCKESFSWDDYQRIADRFDKYFIEEFILHP